MNQSHYDVVIIGLGAVGSATLFQLSKSGLKVLGIDRFRPPHKFGSSHGETRITRLAVGENEAYIPLVMRSHEIWKEIEELTDQKIFHPVGGVLLDSGVTPWEKHGSQGFMKRTIDFADKYKIPHESLSSADCSKRFPNLKLESTGSGYFEPSAGYLFPELAIQTQLDLALARGAEILTDSPVERIERGEIHQVFLADQTITANKIINCSGGWVKDFIDDSQKKEFRICRQVLHWIKTDSPNWEKHPVFMWGFGAQPEDFVYGFPTLDGKSIKVATESFLEIEHPDLLDRTVSEKEQQKFWEEKVEGRILGLKREFVKSEVCFYTVTEDSNFVIRQNRNYWFVSACSGHGFKHSAALGENLSDLVLERNGRFDLVEQVS
ncbi:N-methyl-L-tryptophan oxidase [Algoriphagus pacificus]|uniref:N-methyl-L-tryptophan oxidase n=1 Tax=Algoriphagus pacificus TaxID=2811234 RepID=A0ABS3CAU6_9BACT|nr:N-methyl-L-tryptophan oxidase [Algoriphagus pacificus]MBN7814234.1 N-methyl-L-tryptophan oxidase [Algoriphagus pacificus]